MQLSPLVICLAYKTSARLELLSSALVYMKKNSNVVYEQVLFVVHY